MVRFRTNTANAVGDIGHIFSDTSNTELFETPKFRHDGIDIRDFPLFIKENIDLAMALESGNGVN
jgi:hypothetical protein